MGNKCSLITTIEEHYLIVWNLKREKTANGSFLYVSLAFGNVFPGSLFQLITADEHEIYVTDVMTQVFEIYVDICDSLDSVQLTGLIVKNSTGKVTLQ